MSGDRVAFHSICDKQIYADSVEFPVEDFISALWFNLGKPPETFEHQDFWDKVVQDASDGKAQLILGGRANLKQWIIDNKFHITETFSNRCKIQLNYRLEQL